MLHTYLNLSFIHSFIFKCFLRTYYMLDVAIGAEVIAEDKTESLIPRS